MGSYTSQREKRLYILDCNLSGPSNPYHGRIITCLPDGSDQRTLIDNIATLPDGIAIDVPNNHIYWTNMGTSLHSNTGSIERADLDTGANRTILISSSTVGKGLHTPKQLTIAPRARKLYWCDREGMKVMRANLDGSQVEVLVSTGDSEANKDDQSRWCVGIAVDEAQGWFYWSQKGPSKGNKGRILRAKINNNDDDDGQQNHHEVLFDGLPEPIDLELDVEAHTLYWTDRGDPPTGNSLNRAAVGMGGDRQVLAVRLHEAIGLAVDREADCVYVTDLAGGVYVVDIKTRKKTVLFAELGDLTGITLA